MPVVYGAHSTQLRAWPVISPVPPENGPEVGQPRGLRADEDLTSVLAVHEAAAADRWLDADLAGPSGFDGEGQGGELVGPGQAAQVLRGRSAEHPLMLNQGTLYPALVRLEQKGWIKGTWQRTESNREAKYNAITKAGTRALDKQAVSHADFHRASYEFLELHLGKLANAA